MRPVIKLREADTQRCILDYLAARKIWHRRWNSGALRNAQGVPIHMGQPGDADIICTPALRGLLPQIAVVWIEVKSTVGKQTQEQERFQREVGVAGHYYLVARALEDVTAFFDRIGAL